MFYELILERYTIFFIANASLLGVPAFKRH